MVRRREHPRTSQPPTPTLLFSPQLQITLLCGSWTDKHSPRPQVAFVASLGGYIVKSENGEMSGLLEALVVFGEMIHHVNLKKSKFFVLLNKVC